MMNFSLAVTFIVTVLPIFVVMMGIVFWTDARAKEVDLETNEDYI